MILPIYVYGQPVLRVVADDITRDYPELAELIKNMFETMDRADGVGLAAPQIGLPIRVVVIDLTHWPMNILSLPTLKKHTSMLISLKLKEKRFRWRKAA